MISVTKIHQAISGLQRLRQHSNRNELDNALFVLEELLHETCNTRLVMLTIKTALELKNRPQTAYTLQIAEGTEET